MLLTLPDSLILSILKCLPPVDVARVGQCCQTLRRVCHDEILWRTLFHRYFRVSPFFAQPVAYDSWRLEFIRLVDEIPIVEVEVVTKHTDQVLHVSYSNDGQRFATTSKDAYVHVWNSTHPVILEYSYNMKTFSWKYTQFSQFNESDTLLLVSGVLFGLQSTSGEIVVFSLKGGFNLCCRVVNKPYDVFGSWYTDTYLFSGDLFWLGQMVSKSVIWLNKSSQETESEHTAVMNQVFRFYNPKASSIRSLLVANCIESPIGSELPSSDQPCSSKSLQRGSTSTDSWRHCDRIGNPISSPMEQDLRRVNSRGLRATLQGAFQNWMPLDNIANIDYTREYHRTREAEREKLNRDCQPMDVVDDEKPSCSKNMDVNSPGSPALHHNTYVFDKDTEDEAEDVEIDTEEEDGPEDMSDSESDDDFRLTKLNKLYKSPGGSSSGDWSSCPSTSSPSSEAKNEGEFKASAVESDDVIDPREKWLIFTCGSETYTPHQIGFKKVKPFKFKSQLDPGPSLQDRIDESKRRKILEQNGGDEEEPVNYGDYPSVAHRFDKVDHVIDLHGHIIGMTLSPDHRYLYVNSRPWPSGYTISDPLHPPPIAQEIDIHVIDLVTLKQVGMMRRAHRAYTPNEECFFIFLDACDFYLASGAEDKHGYVWDRHYGVSLCKLPHTDVVNSVAFNPKDSQALITVSDDNTIKIWRSKKQCRALGINSSVLPQGIKLYGKPRPIAPRQSHSV